MKRTVVGLCLLVIACISFGGCAADSDVASNDAAVSAASTAEPENETPGERHNGPRAGAAGDTDQGW